MAVEAALKAELSNNWDVDLTDDSKTIWTNVHRHADGYINLYAFVVEDGASNGAFRVYRTFPLGDGAGTSVDLDVAAIKFASSDRKGFVFDNGERGDVRGWKSAIRNEVGGDVVLAWFADDTPYFSFVARTIKVGGEERVVCGQCEKTDAGIVVRVDIDRPLAEVMLLTEKPKTLSF